MPFFFLETPLQKGMELGAHFKLKFGFMYANYLNNDNDNDTDDLYSADY